MSARKTIRHVDGTVRLVRFRQLEGKRVRSLVVLETMGGTRFPAGTLFKAGHQWGGRLVLGSYDGQGGISGVPLRALELMEEPSP